MNKHEQLLCIRCDHRKCKHCYIHSAELSKVAQFMKDLCLEALCGSSDSSGLSELCQEHFKEIEEEYKKHRMEGKKRRS